MSLREASSTRAPAGRVAGRPGPLAVAVLVAAGLVGGLPGARADKIVTGTKTIQWKYRGAPKANPNGSVKWDLTAIANDKHLDPPQAKNAKDSTTFNPAAGLPKTNKTSGVAGGNGEPEAEAKAEFEVSAPVPVANFGNQVTGKITINVKADTVPETNPPTHGTQSASANGKVEVKLPGGEVTGVEISQPGAAIVVIPAAAFKEGTVGFGAGTGSGKLSDPISLTVNDLTAGTSFTESLFSLDFTGIADGEWSWDSNGIVLDSPLDGLSSATIGLDILSPWVTDPLLVDSRLSLNQGAFTATGVFAGLPWLITPTRVSLSAGLLDAITLPYTIPAALVDPTHTYRPDLNLSQGASVEASAAPVPEPASLALIVTGLGLLLLARRRAATRPGPLSG